MVFSLPYAIKSIFRRKKKNLITAIAIALGVALFIGTQAGSQGVIDTVTTINLESQGNNDITIIQPNSPNRLFPGNITDIISDARATGNSVLGEIETISQRITYSGSVYASASGAFEKNVGIRSVNPLDTGFGDFYDEEGDVIPIDTMLSGNDVIISKTLKEALQLTVGSLIQISVPDGLGNAVTVALTVRSVYDDDMGRGVEGAGPPGTFRVSQLYINLQTIQSLMASDFQDYVTEIQIIVKGVDRSIENFDIIGETFPGKANINAVIDELTNLLNKGHDSYLIYSPRVNLVDNQYANISGLTAVLTLFAVMLNGVALLLIINVQSMAIDDRKNQTAILRALGANQSNVLRVFIIESSIIGIIGALLGTAIGFLLSLWILDILSVVFQITIGSAGLTTGMLFTALVIGVILSVLTVILPSLNSVRTGIANSLRGIEELKKPRKGYVTLFFGIILLPIGLLFATQVGDLTKDVTWENFDDQITILLGFGLTMAGIGLLLTLILNRRLALSLSGSSLFGIGIFMLYWAMKKGKTGDPANLFTLVLFFMIIGSTMIVSSNYEDIMKSIGKVLFFLTGLRAISQVTTRQMIGKKNRGILVYTILTVILVLTMFIASAAETQRVTVVDSYDTYSDGVDIVVVTDNAFAGARERITSINDRISDLGEITDVFGFRRTSIPIYLKSPLDANFDINQHVVGLPLVELDENVINPQGDWGSESLKLQFSELEHGIQDLNDRHISINTDAKEHAEIRSETFDLFFSEYTREQTVVYNEGLTNEFTTVETQYMVMGGFALEYIAQGLRPGGTIYVQSVGGSIIPLFLGARFTFDMMGSDQFPLYANSIFMTSSMSQLMPFDTPNQNLFLVRSENGYQDTKANEKLALAIEGDLNNLNDPNSFSSLQTPANLIGASTTIVKEEVEAYYFEQAAFWDFLGAFSTMGLVIGALGMMIIAIRSVTERTREIGMMRSIGFSRKSVVQGVLIEMFILSLMSLIMGTIIAVIFSENFAEGAFGVRAVYPMGRILSYVFGLLGLAIISGTIPGYNASKVTPSHALRYTG